jgi:hypothetical protein
MLVRDSSEGRAERQISRSGDFQLPTKKNRRFQIAAP